MGQLAGLKRRKLALEMLGTAVQVGLNKRLGDNKPKDSEASTKRQRESSEDGDSKEADEASEPAAKKTRTEE